MARTGHDDKLQKVGWGVIPACSIWILDRLAFFCWPAYASTGRTSLTDRSVWITQQTQAQQQRSTMSKQIVDCKTSPVSCFTRSWRSSSALSAAEMAEAPGSDDASAYVVLSHACCPVLRRLLTNQYKARPDGTFRAK